MPRTPDALRPKGLQLLDGVIWTSAVSLAALLLVEGYELVEHPALTVVVYALAAISVGLSVWLDVRRVRDSRSPGAELRRLLPETLMLLPILLLTGRPSLWALFVFARQALVLLRVAAGTARFRRFMDALQEAPAKVLVLSFLLIIAGGTILLTFPRATTDGQGAGFVDALFTATSATCVTGLATLNTVSDLFEDTSRQTFTTFGQFVIMMLIQIGGLGIMTLSAAMVVILGRRLRLKSASLMQTLLDESSAAALRQSVRDIVTMTFVVEGLGAFVLFFPFLELTDDPGQAAWYAIFHAISAFCNAGFSLFGDSLASFAGDPLINGTHAALIILGGLGFTVVTALTAARSWRHGPAGFWRNLPLHVRLVLLMSAGLVAAGMILYFFLEFDRSLAGLPTQHKLLASFFQSVSLRTAGFNTVDLSEMSRGMLVIACFFMFVGASSGSTGGGVKVTTVAVLFASIRASLFGRPEVEMGRRTIGREVVTRAISIVAIATTVLFGGVVMLMLTQPHIAFESLLFEAVSALGTVGLSLGATSQLTVTGKLIITLLMFVGRLGPLTIALAVGERRSRVDIHFPEARIIVG